MEPLLTEKIAAHDRRMKRIGAGQRPVVHLCGDCFLGIKKLKETYTRSGAMPLHRSSCGNRWHRAHPKVA